MSTTQIGKNKTHWVLEKKQKELTHNLVSINGD